jgi:hypothetical protein
MAVPYTFGSATTSIPLSQLDSNFATTITLGNTAIQLGNTVTTLNNMTLANATVSSGNITVLNATVTNDATISGLTVGKGGGSVSTNTAVGASALQANTGASNTAIGYFSGYSNTSGVGLVAVGRDTLQQNTTGQQNTAVGSSVAGVTNAALQSNTTGSYNIAVGSGALQANTTASNNTAVGYQALYSLTTGEVNNAFGQQAGRSITTGVHNIMIGTQAGYATIATTTGSRNYIIGDYSRASSATLNDQIVIGYNLAGKGDSTGYISAGGGSIYQGNNTTTWATTSDQRLKKNIVDNNTGLDKITAIQVRNFEYRLPEEVDAELSPTDAIKKSGIQLGVIAQELQQILPECVKTESTGVMTVDADNLTWYLINAVKELTARIKQLEGN